MPDGWDAIQSAIKRDDSTGILLYDSAIDLKFYAGQDGFAILKTAWDTDHYGESTIDIYQRYPNGNYGLIHAGTIFHSSLKFELINNNLSFKTEDRGFYAMINNNKNIETALNTGKTKNEIAITPCPSFTLKVHKISNGTLHFTCQAYKLIDVIKYVVSFMTDNRMTVSAPCFESGGIYEGICVVNGHELSSYDQIKHPIVSWDTLSTDLVKRLNVQFSIIGTLDLPIMKIDTFNDFYNYTTALEIIDTPDEIKLETDENRLYSIVEIGSEKTDTTSVLQFPDVYSLTSFRRESFHFKGTNNIDRKLDLVGKLVVSHAVIEVVTENLSGYDSYEDDVFLIQYDVATNSSHQSNWVGSLAVNKHLFNEMFTNQNILNRWSGSLPNDISNTVFNTGANTFKAWCNHGDPISILQSFRDPYEMSAITFPGWHNDTSTNSGGILFDQLPLWNDFTNNRLPSGKFGTDVSNNYGGGAIISPQGNPVLFPNQYFTAPTNGSYSFNALINLTCAYQTDGNTRWRDKKIGLRMIKRDSGGNEIEHHDGSYFNVVDSYSSTRTSGSQSFWVSCTWNTFMNSGERMNIVVYHYVRDQHTHSDQHRYWIYTNGLPDLAGYFECTGINTGGGSVIPSSPNSYKSMKINFNYPLTMNDYENLRNSKQGMISINVGNNRSIRGWIENIKFQHNSGLTQFTLITDGNTIYR